MIHTFDLCESTSRNTGRSLTLNRPRIVGTAEGVGISGLNCIVERDDCRDRASNSDKERNDNQEQTCSSAKPPLDTTFRCWTCPPCLPDPHYSWNSTTLSAYLRPQRHISTYTARGVPHRALMSVKRSSNTGIAREKMKTRTPVPITQDLPDERRSAVFYLRPSCPMLPCTFRQVSSASQRSHED
jgi:hypothetical protein